MTDKEIEIMNVLHSCSIDDCTGCLYKSLKGTCIPTMAKEASDLIKDYQLKLRTCELSLEIERMKNNDR